MNGNLTTGMMRRAATEGSEKVLELLRGGLVPPKEGSEALYEYLEPLAVAHQTAEYKAVEFSEETWTSDAKTRRVRFLESLIEEEGRAP